MEQIDVALCRPLDVEHIDQLSHGLCRRNDALQDGFLDLRHTPLDHGVVEEQVVQMLVHHAVHPIEELLLTTALEHAGIMRYLLEGADDVPQFLEPRLFQRGSKVGMGLPALGGRTDELDRWGCPGS